MDISWRVIVLPLALAACGDQAPAPDDGFAPAASPAATASISPATIRPPTSPPDIRGIVTAADSLTLRVEADPADVSGSPKAVARVTPATVVLYRDGARAGPADLTLGHNVSVWFEGPVAESYPVQATADTVVIEPVGVI